MPAAIQFECEVSAQSIAEFTKALADYQRKTQRDMRGALPTRVGHSIDEVDAALRLRAASCRAPLRNNGCQAGKLWRCDSASCTSPFLIRLLLLWGESAVLD